MKKLFKSLIFLAVFFSSIDGPIKCARRSSGNPINPQNEKTFLQKMNPKYIWHEHKKGLIAGAIVLTTFYLTMKKLVNPLIRKYAIVPGASYSANPCQNNPCTEECCYKSHIVRKSDVTGIEYLCLPSRGTSNNKLVVHLLGNDERINHPDMPYRQRNAEHVLILKYPENCDLSQSSELFDQEIKVRCQELVIDLENVRILGMSLGGLVGTDLAAKHGYRVFATNSPASISKSGAFMARQIQRFLFGCALPVPEIALRPFVWGAGWSGNTANNFLKAASGSDYAYFPDDDVVGPNSINSELSKKAGFPWYDPEIKRRLELPCTDPQSLKGHRLEISEDKLTKLKDDFSGCCGSFCLKHNSPGFGSCADCKKTYHQITEEFIKS